MRLWDEWEASQNAGILSASNLGRNICADDNNQERNHLILVIAPDVYFGYLRYTEQDFFF